MLSVPFLLPNIELHHVSSPPPSSPSLPGKAVTSLNRSLPRLASLLFVSTGSRVLVNKTRWCLAPVRQASLDWVFWMPATRKQSGLGLRPQRNLSSNNALICIHSECTPESPRGIRGVCFVGSGGKEASSRCLDALSVKPVRGCSSNTYIRIAFRCNRASTEQIRARSI